MSYEHVQDVIIALGELCSILIKAAAPDQVLELTYELNSEKLVLCGDVLVATSGCASEELVPWLVERVLSAATEVTSCNDKASGWSSP